MLGLANTFCLYYCLTASMCRLYVLSADGSPDVFNAMQAELDRFCNAMIAIREEIRDIEEGRAEK